MSDSAENSEAEIIELPLISFFPDINLKGRADGIELTSRLTKINRAFQILILPMQSSKNIYA